MDLHHNFHRDKNILNLTAAELKKKSLERFVSWFGQWRFVYIEIKNI